MLVVTALSAFVAYNYLNVSIEVPDNFIFVGRTINSSELYHTDQFSWYTYDQIDCRAPEGNPTVYRTTTEYDTRTYNGSMCLHERDTYTSRDTCTNQGTQEKLLQINDWYFDADGKWIADWYQSFNEDGTPRSNGTFNNSNYTYQKRVFALPYGLQIAPRGTETINIGNQTYTCDRYYLPNQNINNVGTGYQRTFWFADGIPVPVKVYMAKENATFELVDWG